MVYADSEIIMKPVVVRVVVTVTLRIHWPTVATSISVVIGPFTCLPASARTVTVWVDGFQRVSLGTVLD